LAEENILNTISLMTDFGTEDGNVGVMKGVIWNIAPEVKIADLSHDVGPQNIQQAAFILGRHAFYFPENTIHVVVVDPGVGTERRPIAAQFGPQRFVGPDNGVCTGLLERAEQNHWPIEIVHLDQPRYWLSKISDIFHGRDIFSPAAAHWAAGVALAELGTPVGNPVRLSLPRPRRTDKSCLGEVVYIDHFGNIATNIHRNDLAGLGQMDVSLGGLTIAGLVRTFGERRPGELIVLYSSNDYLIVSVVNGNAAQRIKAAVGDPVEVSFGGVNKR
jgi:S-adenosylmethionine hydrolase